MSGLDLHNHLVSIGALPATVILTGHGDIPMAVAALKAGVMDFITKPFDPVALLESVGNALRQAEENERRKVVAEQTEARRNVLTPREAAILALLVQGHSSKVIAAQLDISVRTIEHHRAHIMKKMEVQTLSQLIKVSLGKIDRLRAGGLASVARPSSPGECGTVA